METIERLPLDVHKWLNQRGITDNIISSYHIGWTGEMISIPIIKDGVVLFRKYRRNPFSVEGPKYIYDKGASTELFGTDSLVENTKVFICEGELDALLLISKGFSAVSSTGGAQSFKEDWTPWFKNKSVYICFDNDRAGIEGAIKIHHILPGAKVMTLPENVGEHGDITDFFVKMGKTDEDFKTLIGTSWAFLPFPSVEDLKKHKIFLEIYKRYADGLLGKQRTLRGEGKDNAVLSAFLEVYAELIAESNKKTKKPKVSIEDTGRLESAKQTPITDYMKFNRAGFSKCIWHEENTPSMHYSPKHNRVYCFGCSRNGDVIDVIQELHKVGLKEALQIILEV